MKKKFPWNDSYCVLLRPSLPLETVDDQGMKGSLSIYIMAFVLIVSFCCFSVHQTTQVNDEINSNDFNAIAEELLKKTEQGLETHGLQQKLANIPLERLAKSLDTDQKRYAFWINVYNANIIIALRKDPAAYDDKDNFFTKDHIVIAGETISFDLIEHGILRKSQWKLGLGYVRKWFTNCFERKLRVEERDYRIHFALNCGAKDCPPVAIYTPSRLTEQLKKGTTAYLNRTTKFDTKRNVAKVTPLFSWFRGDFGGKNGIKDILKDEGLLPTTKNIELHFSPYDWTIDINNFIDL